MWLLLHAIDCEELLRSADAAMYAAKDIGRGTHAFYRAEMNQRALQRLDLEAALQRGFRDGEFTLYDQPRIDCATRQVVALEALLRGNSPTRGLVLPNELRMPVVTHNEPVSMSRETPFERNLHAVADRAELGAVFTQLCEQLAADLQRKSYRGRTIGIKLRFDDFRTVTRDQTLDDATADATVIRHASGACLKRVDLSQRLRLLGVRAGGLTRVSGPASPANRAAARRAPVPQGGAPDTAADGSLFDQEPGVPG